jgi:monovalent cation/hydrogen antiporter
VHDVELVLVTLLVAVVGLSAVARSVGIPYPIVLVVGGLVLGFLPVPDAELDPDLVLVIFLPPLLYGSAFFASLRDLKADLRTISLLAVGLVAATAVTVAVVAHALIDGLSWAAAFVLGAIVAPTDPVAATTVARRLEVPRRTINILEGESLINDGSALILFTVALGAVGGDFSLGGAVWEAVRISVGGVLIGLVVGWLLIEIRRRIEDVPIEVTISLLSGYAAYVPAEHLGCSGVLAVVTSAFFVGWRAPEISTATMRLTGFAVWEILLFLLNALLFVLIGLQLPQVLDGLDGEPAGELAAAAAGVCAVVIVTRLVWGQVVTFLIRAIDRRPQQRARRSTWRSRMIIGWSGMRGAVSLAAALSLTVDFPHRNEVLLVTFAVILATLVLQGLTLPWVIRWAGVHDDGAEEREDLLARRRATEAALERIDELAIEEWTYDDTIERMRGLYRYRTRRLDAREGESEEDGDAIEHRSVKYQQLVREVLAAQRRAVVALRNQGEISNDVMHRIERELDLEDERLEI